MTKEKILQKHFTAEYGHDGHGEFMQYILDAMDEYKGQEVKNCSTPVVSSRFYQIEFGNHLQCNLKITDGKIEVEGAINGWGDDVPLEQVVILELNE